MDLVDADGTGLEEDKDAFERHAVDGLLDVRRGGRRVDC